MKYFGRVLVLTVCLGAFAIVVSVLPSHQASAAGSAPVTVANTSTNPVPVAGNVNATIVGTPNVNVNNFPSSIGVSGGSVTVANSLDGSSNPIPLVVRDADNPARQPFTVTCTLAPNTSFATVGLVENCNSSAGGTPRVPANKRLIIEYVSVDTEFIPGSLARVQVQFISGGNNTLVNFIPTNGGQLSIPGITEYVSSVSSPTRLYVDPGSFIDCYGWNNAVPGSFFSNGSCTFSGYLITP